jgi:3-methyladenine DNA glycosylase AlkD
MDEQIQGILERLEALGTAERRARQERFGVRDVRAFGVSVPRIKRLARELGRNHDRALRLWETGWHEARLLAVLLAEPDRLTGEQLEAWAADFNAWDLVDTACGQLIDRTPLARPKLREWIDRDEEYVRRAGFVLMATLAVHDKGAPDEEFLGYLKLIEAAPPDGRNFVKKAIDWAVRQIGKRNPRLNTAARTTAGRLAASDDATRRWIGRRSLRELESPRILERLQRKADR